MKNILNLSNPITPDEKKVVAVSMEIIEIFRKNNLTWGDAMTILLSMIVETICMRPDVLRENAAILISTIQENIDLTLNTEVNKTN